MKEKKEIIEQVKTKYLESIKKPAVPNPKLLKQQQKRERNQQ